MATLTGTHVQFGYAEQPDMTTRTAPNRFVEILQEGLGGTLARLGGQGARGGRRTMLPSRAGNLTVGGATSHQLAAEGFAGILKAAMGGHAVVASGDVFNHTFTPGPLGFYTLQIGQLGEAADHKDVIGAMVNQLTLSWDATGDGAYLALQADWFAHDLKTDQALPVASYPTVYTRLSSLDVAISVGGSAYCVDSGSITISNGISRQFEACAAHPGRAVIREDSQRDITWNLASDAIAGWARHGEYLAQDVVDLSMTAQTADANGDTVGLVVTSKAQWTGETKKMTGMGVIKDAWPAQAVGATDAEVCTMVLTTSDATV